MFEQNLNWQRAAQGADGIAQGVVGLADLAGYTPQAQARARAQQVFAGRPLSSLGQIDPRGMPLPGRQRAGNPMMLPSAPAGASAPVRTAGNPSPEDTFGKYSAEDLAALMTDPRLDEFSRRTAAALYERQLPRDPMEVEAAQLDMAMKRAQMARLEAPDYGFMTMPDGTLVRTEQKSGQFDKLGQFQEPQRPARNDLETQYNTRIKMAEAAGLSPGDPRYQAFLLTGDMPREGERRVTTTEMKEIFEADDMARASEATISLLQQAKALSGQAYDGAFADTRGWLSSQVGSDAGIATRNLNTVLTETALSQLKAIFGGAPTEGERQILLDISGSANQPRMVRDAIIDRAIAAANARLRYNQKKAQMLRTGEYFDAPGSQPQAAGQQMQPLPDPLGIR